MDINIKDTSQLDDSRLTIHDSTITVGPQLTQSIQNDDERAVRSKKILLTE